MLLESVDVVRYAAASDLERALGKRLVAEDRGDRPEHEESGSEPRSTRS
jgi:hypothetical protein